ncbi:hypothetical protein ACROYT_G004404 [Oculina patagonica]
MYANSLQPLSSATKQCWFADDVTGSGSLDDVKKWWDDLSESGPALGYFPNAKKCWLITKPDIEDAAREVFANTAINITSEGHKHLGAVLGSRFFLEEYVGEMVEDWVHQVSKLAEFAISQPQASYAAFTVGLRHRLYRRKQLTRTSKPLVQRIVAQNHQPPDAADMRSAISHAGAKKNEFLKGREETVKNSLSPRSLRAAELASEKGASSWLTVIPIKDQGYDLNKREFRDTVKMRYSWGFFLTYQSHACAEIYLI